MNMHQKPINAIYMRGGTSKGIFFSLNDLPISCKHAGKKRDDFLLRVMGSPDAYNKQIDGLGNASSSTSKAVILAKSSIKNHDVDYLFGQVSIDTPVIDWSGNCGNLTAAVGACAIHMGLVDTKKIPQNGVCDVVVWQKNICKTIIVSVPIKDGQVQELGNYYLDGVAFPAAKININFINPINSALLPTGNVQDILHIDGLGDVSATLINAGIPTVFLYAQQLGLTATETQEMVNNNAQLLTMLERIRTKAALKMGLINTEADKQLHTPKIAWVSEANSYQASSGKTILKSDIDFLVRALSMGKLHHAMMATTAIAIACAANVKGSIINQVLKKDNPSTVCFGHPSGTFEVGCNMEQTPDGVWQVNHVYMQRSARRIMSGQVFIPCDLLK